MTWTKLGAEWPDEARHLSSDAYRLHVDALCYSNRLLTDLIINKTEVQRFSWIADSDAAARELVAGGWWEDRGLRFYIGLKFDGWQRSRGQVEAKRSTDTRAQRRKRLHDSGDHADCLRSCPSSPAYVAAYVSSTDTAHDNANESSSFSERNGTERHVGLGTVSAPTTTSNPWDDHPVAVPGGRHPPPDWAMDDHVVAVPRASSSSRLAPGGQSWADELYAREQ